MSYRSICNFAVLRWLLQFQACYGAACLCQGGKQSSKDYGQYSDDYRVVIHIWNIHQWRDIKPWSCLRPSYFPLIITRSDESLRFKPGFHYPSWRPELTARVDGWPVSITRQHGPLTRAVNLGSGNRALDSQLLTWNFDIDLILTLLL